MKRHFLYLVGFALLMSCQSLQQNRSSDLADLLSTSAHPALLAFQFLTVDLERQKGAWPESRADYKAAFEDSAAVVLQEFDKLVFTSFNDSLVIAYALQEPSSAADHTIDFVAPGAGIQAPKYSLDSRVEQVKNSTRFIPGGGRLVFSRDGNQAYRVTHEYAGAVVKNSIKATPQ